MGQTAAFSKQQYLQISDKEIKALPAGSFEPSEKVISFPSVESQLFDKVSPFYYKSRARISFSISEEFRAYYVMIKGLIEFNRPKHFSFSYNSKQGTFETDVEVDQIKGLQLFFENVLVLLRKEIEFKQALKLVLQFENRYKHEMTKVYRALNATTATRPH